MPCQGDEVEAGGIVGRLLRGSVSVYAMATAAGAAFLLLRALLQGDRGEPGATWVLLTLTLLLAGIAATVASKRVLTTPQLRALKDANFAAVAAGIAIFGYLTLAAHLRSGNPVAVPAAWHLMQLQVGLLMCAYGVLLPTALWRALGGIGLLAVVPLTVPLALLLSEEAVAGPFRAIAGPALVGDSLLGALGGLVVAVLVATISSRYFDTLYEARLARRYKLFEKIGAGGMGEVWRAEHNMLARTAAVKLINLSSPKAEGDELALRRFEVEAQATAAMRSPHTIEVYDFGTTEAGTFYYAMEYLDGYNFETLVASHGPLPPGRVISLVRQACSSLAEAHERGLVHRDIKPANLFVCRLGGHLDFVKVLDFGIVKRGEDTEADIFDGSLSGTPAFMSPETIADPVAVDRRADLYALGCVAYHLLSGRQVFDGASAAELIREHLNTVPLPPSHKTKLPIPADLERVVLKCIEKDPAARYQTAGALAAALEACESHGTWSAQDAAAWWQTH